MIIDRPCSQIAYFVPDVRAAALEHHRTYGSGPFYVIDEVALTMCRYRGEEAEWAISSAFGQWGDLQVEFMQQNDDRRSMFTDVFPAGSGRFGLHHLAYIPNDMWGVAAALEDQGHPVILHAKMSNGIEALMIDTQQANGHMVELYEPTAPLIEFYDHVRRGSVDFDGTDPVRRFET